MFSRSRARRWPPLGCEPLEGRTLPSAAPLAPVQEQLVDQGGGQVRLSEHVDGGGWHLSLTHDLFLPPGATGSNLFGPRPNLAEQAEMPRPMTLAGPAAVAAEGQQVLRYDRDHVASVLLKCPAEGIVPTALCLADLNGDGLPDLVVADGAGDRLFVFPGTRDGFGSEITGGKGLPVGDDPVGLKVADLDGSGRRSLIVTDRGSDDVRVIRGEGTGAGWSLVPAACLTVGAGPTSTLVADVDGDGVPDLIVTEGGSNDVIVLPGLGNGRFADQPSLRLATGSDPVMSVVGDFSGDGKLDLITVNRGSNDLTWFHDLGHGEEERRTIPSGGTGPVAALAGPVNGDRASDLVVANSDGHVVVFRGGPDGPQPVATFEDPGARPAAMAWGGDGGSDSAYIANEDGSLTTVTFSALPGPDEGGAGDGAGDTRPDTTELHPLPSGALGVVPTVVVGEPRPAPAEGEAHALVAPPGNPPSRQPGGPQKEEERTEGPAAPEQAGSAALDRFVQGVEEATRDAPREAHGPDREWPHSLELAVPGELPSRPMPEPPPPAQPEPTGEATEREAALDELFSSAALPDEASAGGPDSLDLLLLGLLAAGVAPEAGRRAWQAGARRPLALGERMR